MNSSWIVEFYSNDNREWLKCSITYLCLGDAMRAMREHAEIDTKLAHRVVHLEIKRQTIALSAYGEELIK